MTSGDGAHSVGLLAPKEIHVFWDGDNGSALASYSKESNILYFSGKAGENPPDWVKP